MKIEKTKNGKYRVRLYTQGVRYCVTFDKKPKEAEILEALNDKMAAKHSVLPQIGSINDYAIKYLYECEKRNLSPSTVRGYESILRNTNARFLSMPIKNLTENEYQRVLNNYARNHSPKSVRLWHGFYKAVIASNSDFKFTSVKLPPLNKKQAYEPSTKDIEQIIEYSKGSVYHVALQLAVLGLRRGEICALKLSDLSTDNVLTINKDLVIDKDNKIVIKNTPKTERSNRRILIPEALANEIRAQGYIYKSYPNSINKYLARIQNALGIPHFKLHTLRAFACAYLHQQGYTDSQILAYGGWEESSDVMKRVYRYNLDPEKAQKDIAQSFGNLF